MLHLWCDGVAFLMDGWILGSRQLGIEYTHILVHARTVEAMDDSLACCLACSSGTNVDVDTESSMLMQRCGGRAGFSR